MIELTDFNKYKKPKKITWYLFIPVVFLVLIIGVIWWLSLPPSNFPINKVVIIPRGYSASQISYLMRNESLVKSDLLLYLVLVWKHDPSLIQAGTYVFEDKTNTFGVANRIVTQGVVDNLVALTLPEGFTNQEFADLASKVLPDFSADEFIGLTSNLEGYLFPDTYYIAEDFSAEELKAILQETFAAKTADLKDRMSEHPLGEYGVITLASLIEREANSHESMKMVSGILQNRLKTGMRLQTDASMEYVLHKPLHSLNANDLQLDSPYNTYLYDGLPPTPIGNPGLMSIEAVLEPTESDYFYYITDAEGNFYYAKTFDEHRSNIAKYLK